MIFTSRARASGNSRSSAAICPYRCTGTIARVRGVSAAATAAGSMLKVSGSTSTKTGVPPALWIAPAVAKNVNGVVITSSPGSSRSALSASSSASVPLAHAMACGARQRLATAASSCTTGGPMTNCWDSMTACRAGSTSSRMARYCATRSNSGTFTWSVSFEGATIYPGRRGEAISRSAPFDSSYVAPQAAHSLRAPTTTSRSPHWHIHPTRRAGTPSIRPKAGTSAVTTAPAPMKAYSPKVTPHTIVALAPIELPRFTRVGRYACLRETWARGFTTLVNTHDGPEHVVFEHHALVDRDVVLDIHVVPDARPGHHHDVLAQVAALADHGAGHDVTEVPDLRAFADPGAFVDVARLVDEVVGH